MQFITDEYRGLNKELHERNKSFGVSGQRYTSDVLSLCQVLDTKDVLDYGCGKSTLANNLPFTIKQYDPAIPKYESLPSEADIVVCTDVLEHIEPELIDNVLDHIQSLAKRASFLTIAIGPAIKTLADGRNAHLIQETPKWWMSKLWDRFVVINFCQLKDDSSPDWSRSEIRTVVIPKDAKPS